MGFDPIVLPDNDSIIFPAGTMFWGRVSAVKNLFDLDLSEIDFPKEAGQTDGTYMHAIERLWVCIAEQNGYTYCMTRNVADEIEC